MSRFRFVVHSLLLLSAVSLRAQWQILDANTTADLRGIDNVGNGVAWASGTNGTVLRTGDGGATWQLCAVPPNAATLDFRGVQAFDSRTAVVMSSGKGDLSRLYKTTDGCRTWKLLFTDPDETGFFDALSFLPMNVSNHDLAVKNLHGTLLGDPVDGTFSIFQTYDGGSTWRRRIESKKRHYSADCKVDVFAATPGESAFAASNEALLFLHPYFFAFVTGGTHPHLLYVDHFDLDFSFCHERAREIALPLGNGSPSSGAFAMAADHAMDGQGTSSFMIVGGDYQKPNEGGHTAIFVTTGLQGRGLFPSQLKILTHPSDSSPNGYRSAVAYDAITSTWITVGPNGTDISTDDGKHWRPLKPGPNDQPDADAHWNALSLPFVVGAHGRIGKLEPEALRKR